MTPEEILRGLRDIHLPEEQAAQSLGVGIVLWPAGLVLILGALVGWIIWRRRTAWRREALAQLDKIERQAAAGQNQEGWTALSILLRRIAMRTSKRPEDIAGLVGQAWLKKLNELFTTDIFVHGPGRLVVQLPYGCRTSVDSGGQGQQAEGLRLTIRDVRKRLRYLRAAQ